MSKHTKGPWVAVENDGAYVKDPKLATWRVEERGSSAEMVVAVVVSDIALLAKKVEANARLMAAAPEMLAALNECRELIAAEFCSDEASAMQGHPIDKAARKAWDIVNSAIARAEGRS